MGEHWLIRRGHASSARNPIAPIMGIRFYKTMIPIADRLNDEYITELKKEGLIK